MDTSQTCSGVGAGTCGATESQCRLVTRRLHDLSPHPSYIRHHLSVPASQLSALAALGNLAFREPIVIMRNGTVIDGYARLQLARRQRRETLLCIEYDLTDEEALSWLIQSHRPSRGLNAFTRVLLALGLEPSLQEAARANQRNGGQNKGSSGLTEAERVDVRAKIAAAAAVSLGNVTKVRQVLRSAHPQVQQSVGIGEISIHMAWQLSRFPHQQQRKELEEYRSRKGTTQTSRILIKKHIAALSPTQLMPSTLGDLLKPLGSDRSALLEPIIVAEIEAPGNVAYLTKNAMRTLKSLEE